MRERVVWAAEDAEYIRTRSVRYPGAFDIEPAWTDEAMDDQALIELDRGPKSRIGASRFIGYPPTADRILVVIAYRDVEGALHGVKRVARDGPRSGRTKGDHDGEAQVHSGGSRADPRGVRAH